MLWKLPEISVPADTLFMLGPIPVTNTLLLSVISSIILVAIFIAAVRKASIIPGPVQNFVEWVFQTLLDLCEEVAGKEKGRTFFPWVATIFLLVLVANWWEVIPGIEMIGTLKPGVHANFLGIFLTDKGVSNEITPWFRPPSTDLNFTLALAIVTVIMTQLYGFKMLGFREQIGRYITLREGPIGLMVGLLEVVLELMRLISLSFRLFGNLFAGDVLLLVMAFLVPFLGAVPFYFLEVFVGFIQAFVFAFLTLIFMTLGTTTHGHADHEEEHAAEVAHEEHERAALALTHQEGVPAA